MNINSESIRQSPTGKVRLEIVLSVEFKLWDEKCKYLEQLSIKRQRLNPLKPATNTIRTVA